METFAPKPGCPLCSIVTAASDTSSPSTSSTSPEILWKDDTFTAYREKASPVSSTAHIIIAFNLHVPSIYTLSSTDLPLLVHLRTLAHRLLQTYLPNGTANPPLSPAFPNPSQTLHVNESHFRVGFITPPFSDNKIPVKDHLHAHAYIFPADLLGWWRRVNYGPLAWYAIEDLIAEIRESVSNNRIKSGYNNRIAPIDNIPDAGARSGTADGIETSAPPIATVDIDVEAGESRPHLPRDSTYLSPMPSSSPSPTPSFSPSPSPEPPTFPPPAQIPQIRV